MDRYEILGKRLCDYLGLNIVESQPGARFRCVLTYHIAGRPDDEILFMRRSWESFLFDRCKFSNSVRTLKTFNNDVILKNPIFDFENLDELEMQLSIRGF